MKSTNATIGYLMQPITEAVRPLTYEELQARHEIASRHLSLALRINAVTNELITKAIGDTSSTTLKEKIVAGIRVLCDGVKLICQKICSSTISTAKQAWDLVKSVGKSIFDLIVKVCNWVWDHIGEIAMGVLIAGSISLAGLTIAMIGASAAGLITLPTASAECLAAGDFYASLAM